MLQHRGLGRLLSGTAAPQQPEFLSAVPFKIAIIGAFRDIKTKKFCNAGVVEEFRSTLSNLSGFRTSS